MSFLSLRDLVAVTRVSKDLCSISQDDSLYKSICGRMGVTKCSATCTESPRPWFEQARTLHRQLQDIWTDYLASRLSLELRRKQKIARRMQNTLDRIVERDRRRSQASAASAAAAEPSLVTAHASSADQGESAAADSLHLGEIQAVESVKSASRITE